MLNWNQTGMPSALVSRLGQRREIAAFKSVLNDAQNHILQSVDTESMAQELVQSGGREYVDMVKELTAALKTAKKELEDANRRYERLTADLARRGIRIAEDSPSQPTGEGSQGEAAADDLSDLSEKPKSPADGQAEWEEWDRRFRALLD